MNTSDPFQFYAAEISYFSAKVRPALRYKGVPYVERLPTRAAYRQVIIPRTGLAFIPILITPEDETWIGRDAVPLQLDTLRAFEAWADARPAGLSEPPRAVGFHETDLRGARFQRYTSPYALWMAQRTRDAWRALAPAERARAARALEGTGCEALLAWAPRHRVVKRRFKLVLESQPA